MSYHSVYIFKDLVWSFLFRSVYYLIIFYPATYLSSYFIIYLSIYLSTYLFIYLQSVDTSDSCTEDLTVSPESYTHYDSGKQGC